jgi:malate dehydrogenase
MSRDELLETNARIVRDVVKNAVQKSPNSIIVMVSNPLDAMTYVAYKTSRFPRERIIGMAGVLDSARFRAFISMELDVSPSDVHALVLGGHGDLMVPLLDYTDVVGIPISGLIKKDRLDAIIQRTRDGGAEIVNLLKTGSAYYAPAASTAEMVEAVLNDRKKILPCSVLCQGEYGFTNIFLGLPVKLGRKGVEEIIKIELSGDDKKALQRSAESVKELCGMVDKMLTSG